MNAFFSIEEKYCLSNMDSKEKAICENPDLVVISYSYIKGILNLPKFLLKIRLAIFGEKPWAYKFFSSKNN